MTALLFTLLLTALSFRIVTAAPVIDIRSEQIQIEADSSLPDSISPSLALDFPDPAFMKTNGIWYAFGTSSRGLNVQVAVSKDFKRWMYMDMDAMPELPDWVDRKRPLIWAPDVIKSDNGRYVLYYSATHVQTPWRHCIGVALALDASGPYSPLPEPLICPDPDGTGLDVAPMIQSPGKGGAIDASGFRDTDGSRYVIYKVDGNSLQSGGPCGNGGSKKVPTPLMMVQVGEDGYTQLSSPRVLLNRSERDGPLIEAPSMAKLKDGSYALFYSSNCFNSPYYDVSYATSKSIWGPYMRSATSMLKTGTAGLIAPGGASVSDNGERILFHANFQGGRAMFASSLSGNTNELRLAL